MLLIVTNKTDLACDYLILELRQRRINFLRVNAEDLGREFSVDICVGPGQSGFKVSPRMFPVVDSHDIDAVYFRQVFAPPPPPRIAHGDLDFAQRESVECLRSVWRLIPEGKWVNHPRRLWLASNKVEQLAIAQDLGLNIPSTLVSASKDTVADFFDIHDGRLICKAVKHGFVHRETHALIATTQRIDEKFLLEFENYASVPMIYQNEIPKTFDVRVTVVGEAVFATAIHSQENKETEVDWRVADVARVELAHERIDLPIKVADDCRRITQHFGLRYSAIDLVLDTEGTYFFLELNPNGQWGWIEEATGYPIREALIRCMGYG